MDYISELRRIVPLIRSVDYYSFDLRAEHDITDMVMDDWGMNKKEFIDLVNWMNRNDLLIHVAPYEQIEHPDTGMIVDEIPDMYVPNRKAIKRFLGKSKRAAIRNDKDFLEALRRIEPMLKKYDYRIITEDLGRFTDMENSDALDDWGVSRDDFYDIIRYMELEDLVKIVQRGYEEEDEDTGVILNVYPDIYETDYRAVQKYLKKHSRLASWDDPRWEDSGLYDDPPEERPPSREEEFYEYLMDTEWDFECVLFEKEKVSYRQSVKLGLEAIRQFKHIKRVEKRYGELLAAYDETQSLQDDYYSKSQMGRWSKSEQRLNELDKQITKTEKELDKLYKKYGKLEDWVQTLEDFVDTMALHDRAGTLAWGVTLSWDLRAEEWDTDVNPGDFVDSPY